jgi:hypothetical protein
MRHTISKLLSTLAITSVLILRVSTASEESARPTWLIYLVGKGGQFKYKSLEDFELAAV